MKYLIGLLLVIISSCVVAPKYYLDAKKSLQNFSIKDDDKFVLIKNNFPLGATKLSATVDSDFSKIINKVLLNPSFLEFNNDGFIRHINDEQSDILKSETGCNYLLLIQTLLIPSISHQKSFTSVTTYEKKKKRIPYYFTTNRYGKQRSIVL